MPPARGDFKWAIHIQQQIVIVDEWVPGSYPPRITLKTEQTEVDDRPLCC